MGSKCRHSGPPGIAGQVAKDPSYLHPLPSTVSGWPRSPPPPLLSTKTTPHPSVLHRGMA